MRFITAVFTGVSALACVLFADAAEAAEGEVRFALQGASDVEFIRAYVGLASRAYDVKIDLRGGAAGSMSEMIVRDASLARVLSEPRVYFVALTSVDPQGRESGFSNELRLDLRSSNCPAGADCSCNGVCPAPAPAPAPSPAPAPTPAPAPAPSMPPSAPAPDPGFPAFPVPGAPSVSVSVNGQPFRGQVMEVPAGLPVRFSAVSSSPRGLGFPVFSFLGLGQAVQQLWDFDGGLASNALQIFVANPNARFLVPLGQASKRFDVDVTVFDTSGLFTTVSVPIRAMSTPPPSLDLRVNGQRVEPRVVIEVPSGAPVRLSALASDPDGLGFPVFLQNGVSTPVTYLWSFGGGVPQNPLSVFVPQPVVRFEVPVGRSTQAFDVMIAALDRTGATTLRTFRIRARR